MIRILVDTSIIIDYIRQKDKRKTILVHLEQSQSRLFASILTYAECYAGKSIWEKKEAMETLKILFSNIEIVPIDEIIAKRAGSIRARSHIDLLDAIIAATALVHELDLATLNVKDFVMIKDISLFQSKK